MSCCRAPYPIRSNENIAAFFDLNRDVEFIRACNCTRSPSKYLNSKARHRLFFERPNFFKKVLNKLTRVFDLNLRAQTLMINGERRDIYWGCAQWALTRACVSYLLEYEHDIAFNKSFSGIFPADETYFHSLIFNSAFSGKTTHGGSEPDVDRLAKLKNLHYFEYPTTIRVLTIDDLELVKGLDYLFIRKVDTEVSASLLIALDAWLGS